MPKSTKTKRAATAAPAAKNDSGRLAAIRAAADRAAQQKLPTNAYFLLLSRYEQGGRRFVRLPSPTVLAWFQRTWQPLKDKKDWRTDLRGDVHGLGKLFEAVEKQKLAAPTSDEELIPHLEKLIAHERGLQAEPHYLHVETNDDEEDMEYFVFDDEFLKLPEAVDRLPEPRRTRSEAELESDDKGGGDAYSVFIRKRLDWTLLDHD